MATHRRKHRVLALLLAALAAGAAALVVVLVFGGSRPAHLIVHESQAVRQRIVRSRIVHLKPTLALPRISRLERRKHAEEPLNERRPETRAARRGTPFIKSSSISQTPISAIPTALDAEAFSRFQRTRFVDSGADFTAEPSVAASRGRILETWNWLAALSSDNGQTFTFVDPSTAFPPAHDGFCCDQVAYFVPGRAPGPDLWVWLLQYGEDEDGNVLRLATALGDTAFDAARSNASTFRILDLSPTDLHWPKDAWFDFNGLSSTNDNLFISTNVASDSGYEGVVIRIPLAELRAGNVNLGDLRYFKTGKLGSPRLARGGGDTMYFAAHVNIAKLRVWTWQDGETPVGSVDVVHSAYRNKRPFHCRRKGGAASSDWCMGLRQGGYKNDDALLAGWVANGLVGFAWDAAQDKGHGFPYPFVMAVELHADTLTLAAQPVIWSTRFAYQYPAIVPNARGDLGGMVFRGGGSTYEACTALVRDSVSARMPSGWAAYDLDSSNSDPAAPYAGDYLGVSSAGAGSNTWVGGCMTLRGGSTRDHLAIDYLSFGRAGQRSP